MEHPSTLLLISTPGGALTYEDHDIVECMAADKSPGSAVEANNNGQWSFVYITDKTCMETMGLRSPLTVGEGEDEQQVSKRKFCCVLDETRADICKTYRSIEEAPEEQKMTWAQFEATYFVDKTA